MGFYDKHILPRFINCACGTKPIMKQREKVVPLATSYLPGTPTFAGYNFWGCARLV